MMPLMTALDDANQAQIAVRRAEATLAKARAHRDSVVMGALAEGHNPATIGKTLGVTASLIHKIAAAGGDMQTTTPTANREARLRRAVARRGHTLSKVREGTPDFWQYGPYIIVNTHTNGVVSSALDLDDVEQWVDESEDDQ